MWTCCSRVASYPVLVSGDWFVHTYLPSHKGCSASSSAVSCLFFFLFFLVFLRQECDGISSIMFWKFYDCLRIWLTSHCPYKKQGLSQHFTKGMGENCSGPVSALAAYLCPGCTSPHSASPSSWLLPSFFRPFLLHVNTASLCSPGIDFCSDCL